MQQAETVMSVRSVRAGDLVKRGAGALVLSVVVNAVIVFVALAAAIAPGFDPLNYGPVAVFTALGVVGATLVYGVLSRFVADADRTFAIVAGVVLLLSFVPDVTFAPSLPGATTAGVVVLAILHVTTAAICVALLTDFRERF